MLSDISLFDNVRQTHARFHCDYFAINLCISISLSKMNRILLLTHFTRSVTRPSLATLPQTMCHRQFCSKPKLPSMLEVKRIERRPEYRDGATKSDIDWNYEMQEIYKEENSHSLLDPVQDEQSIDVEPQIAMTFNLAAYANKLPALQQLLKLGVNLYKIERRKGLAKYLVTLDFERHMKEHIFFLTKVVGLDVDLLGAFLTKNPLIFRESIDDLQTRINYLESKKFTPSDIAYIIQMNPFWLMFSVKRIDARLGFFQREFELTGNQVRQLTLKSPRLITYRLETIRELTFVVREEMEWPKDETRALLLKCPKMWLIPRMDLMERYDIITKEMKIPQPLILQNPEIFETRGFILRERHGFLKSLGRAQYDPKHDLYVPLHALIVGTNEAFAVKVAKSTYEEFDKYLRTL